MDKTMERFFDQSLGREAYEDNATVGQKLYQSLVFHRFNEVISNAFPILHRHVDKTIFHAAIKRFIQEAPSTPFIWEVPLKFWEFEQTHRLLGLPYCDDLLWYEWSEVSLMMDEYPVLLTSEFSWESAWTLHESVRLRALQYRVFEEKFDTPETSYLLAWYDTHETVACYKEIGEALFRFLTRLEQSTWKSALADIALQADVEEDALRNYFDDALHTLARLGILRRIES